MSRVAAENQTTVQTNLLRHEILMILLARVTSQQHRRSFQLCDYFDTRKCGNILNATPSDRTNQRKTTKSRLIRYIDKANKNISMRRSASHYARKLIGPIRVTLIDIHDSMSSLLRGAHTWSCQNVKAEPRRNSIRRVSFNGEQIPG